MRNLIVITRPIEDAEDYAGELQAAGFKTFVEPMLSIEALDFEVPDLKDYDGLILTSANALRIYRENVGAVDLEISVYCVGKHTAAYAHSCGFKNGTTTTKSGTTTIKSGMAMATMIKNRMTIIDCRMLPIESRMTTIKNRG